MVSPVKPGWFIFKFSGPRLNRHGDERTTGETRTLGVDTSVPRPTRVPSKIENRGGPWSRLDGGPAQGHVVVEHVRRPDLHATAPTDTPVESTLGAPHTTLNPAPRVRRVTGRWWG